MSSISKVYSIGLLMHAEYEHMRQIALGAVEFQRENPRVNVVGDGFNPLLPWSHLGEFKGDGVIAIVNSQSHITLLKKLKIPFVLAGSRFLRPEFPVVASDSLAIGTKGAEYMLSCGLKHLLFIGSNQWDDERLRHLGFANATQAGGGKCELANVTFGEQTEQDLVVHYGGTNFELISEVLVKHRKPVGVFCPNSIIGRLVIEACRSSGLSVPDEVAVLAVNDDPLLCETTVPALSTIVQSSSEIGFQAASLLFDLMSERESLGSAQPVPFDDAHPAPQKFLPPRRIAVRRSTDVLVFGDPTIESALRFMRDRAHTEIDITSIADHVDVSRRTLELKFRSTLKKTPRQELLRMRLEISKSLLADSRIPITEIALRSGFGSSQVFSAVFKKSVKVTPSQFRSQSKGQD